MSSSTDSSKETASDVSVQGKSQLPDLSPDIWRLIVSHLTIVDLTSLSQVCKQFHRAVVSEEVFEHFYLKRTSNVVPPVALQASVSWANLYRRTCAIRRSPSILTNTPLFEGSVRILAHVADTVVLYCELEQKIRGYPAGWVRDLDGLCDDPREVIACCVEVPGLGLGFLQSKTGVQGPAEQECWSNFTTIDAIKGDVLHVVRIPVGQNGLSHSCMEYCVSHQKALFLGGRDGQYLAYFVDGGDVLRVVERQTGDEVRNFAVVDRAFGRLLRSVFPETGGFTVTGVVNVEEGVNISGQRKCIILPLDDEPHAMDEFCVEEGEELVDVVRGRPPRTIAYRVTKDRKSLTVWRVEVACTEDERHSGGALVEWQRRWPIRVSNVDDSSLVMASEEFSMSANGRQIFLLPQGIRSKLGVRCDGRVFRATFDKDGMMSSVESMLGTLEPPCTRWSWTAMCLDNRILVVCAQTAGLISVFDLELGQRLWSAECSEALWDMALVGEHYLVGVGANSGTVHAWHFDAFCPQPGQMSCAGLWTAGNCLPLFPGSVASRNACHSHSENKTEDI